MITPALILNWFFQTLVAFVSTIAFAIIFHSPKREYIWAGFSGAAGWLTYILCTHFGLGIASSSFLATLALTFLSRLFAILRKNPVTVYLICGIFPLVPGTRIYYTGYYFFMGDNSKALSMGLESIKVAIAIALGIGIVFALPWQLFAPHRAKNGNSKEGA